MAPSPTPTADARGPSPLPAGNAESPLTGAGPAQAAGSLAASLAQAAPVLAASLAEVIANLKTGLPPAALDDANLLSTAILLAQLEAATHPIPTPAGPGAPLGTLETVDAYRWALLVGLNYRPPLGRPVRAKPSVGRPRCETCHRLLELTGHGRLVCPTC